MAKHKYNDFDDSILRECIVVEEEFPYKKELIKVLHEKGYYNETIAERLAYVFMGNTNNERYDEIARQMSAVISLKKYKNNQLLVKDIKGDDIILSGFATHLFKEGVKEFVLGILGRGQSDNFAYLKRFAYEHPAPRDNSGRISSIQLLHALATTIVNRKGAKYEYYGIIPSILFEEAIQESYEYLCDKVDLIYPWRGYVPLLVGPYDQALHSLCSRVFDGTINQRQQLEHTGKAIQTLCRLSNANSALFRMLEDYSGRIYYSSESDSMLIKPKRYPVPNCIAQQQLDRLRKGVMSESTANKKMTHLSYQYIYYALSGNVIAPDGYVSHSCAETIYDLYHVFYPIEKSRSGGGLTAKEKHKNICRSFEIDPTTGLYRIGL